MMTIDNALTALGYTAFRPGQREAIEVLLEQRRLLFVAPTGRGKSLCYQLPAVMLPGTTLVISPLIALMHDQVQALNTRGIAATWIASNLSSSEVKARMAEMARGKFKIVYAAPERLVFPGFRGLLKSLNCPLITIDEAHCISEWGHDFRPEYLRIGELVADFPEARVLACTATATPVVRDEILSRLGLDPNTRQIVQGFARPNLALSVIETDTGKQRQQEVDHLLHQALGGPGKGRGCVIIYAPTRKATEEEADRLKLAHWRALAYHAGLKADLRENNQRAFHDGTVEVMVATNAFGMGIDRGDVRAVIHLAPPGSVESYYQEVGRAGRDGAPAWGLMLLSPQDMPLRRTLLERGDGNSKPNAEIVEHKWQLFLELMRWAQGGSCRHDAILRYFGDENETLQGCGICDVCHALEAPEAQQDSAATTLIVRKALSGVARVHGRFGLTAAVALLRGVSDARLAGARLDQLSTYGILQEYPESWITALLRRCVTAGWVDFMGATRPVAVLTDAGVRAMRGELPVRLVLPSLVVKSTSQRSAAAAAKPKSRSAANKADADENYLDGTAALLFEALRRHRLEKAKDLQVPPYVIASDRTLRDVALLRPRNVTELKMCHGIGDTKAERFGPGLLQVVTQALQSTSVSE